MPDDDSPGRDASAPPSRAEAELWADRILAQARVPRRPQRIACLTEETVETLYLLGAGDLVVGVSRYAVRPPEVATKPRVCAFVKADLDAVERLEPDLVLCFSDLQADIAAACARRGLNVVVTNQRSVAEILGSILSLGALVGREREASALVERLTRHVEAVATRAAALPRRPRVFVEEWDDPLITAIRWVAEVVTIAGGDYVFPSQALEAGAAGRIVAPADVVARDPEVILACWCGKAVRPEVIRARPGWDGIAAVRAGRIHEVDPAILLQPGPAVLTDGLDTVAALMARAAAGR